MRHLCLLLITMTGLVEAQDGAALYKERCASCHDSPTGRIPSISTIKKMTGEAVYAALTNGAMKSQTSGLSTQQVISLLVYIAPGAGRRGQAKPTFEKSCTGNAPFKARRECLGWMESGRHHLRYQGGEGGGTRGNRRAQAQAQMGVQSRGGDGGARPASGGRQPGIHRHHGRRCVRPSTRPAGVSIGPSGRGRACGRALWPGRPMVFPRSSLEIAAR